MLNSLNENRRLSIANNIALTEQKIKESHEKQRAAKEVGAVSNIKQNPKYSTFCKRFSKTKTQIGPLQTVEGTMTKSPEETRQILMQQYSSVSSTLQS